MRLSVIAHPVAHRAPLHRVLVPAARLRDTRVGSTDHRCVPLTGSRADLLRLGALVRLAAVSRHSAVHVPLGTGPDLVVVRRDAGLRPSAWPEVRAEVRRSRARPAATRTPAPRPPRAETSERVVLTEYAATAFLVGDARSLFLVGDTLTRAGEALASSRWVHRRGVAHLDGLTSAFGGPDDELDIVGQDPIFHRSRWAGRRGAQRAR